MNKFLDILLIFFLISVILGYFISAWNDFRFYSYDVQSVTDYCNEQGGILVNVNENVSKDTRCFKEEIPLDMTDFEKDIWKGDPK